MTTLDWIVLLGTMLGIAGYGTWRTRRTSQLDTYLKGSSGTGWFTIGVSVAATQASAITFLSIPGQGFESGIGFVQNYFGLPLALILVCAVFLPIYRRLGVYTAYEYLGRRFDAKTRLLGAGLFLLIHDAKRHALTSSCACVASAQPLNLRILRGQRGGVVVVVHKSPVIAGIGAVGVVSLDHVVVLMRRAKKASSQSPHSAPNRAGGGQTAQRRGSLPQAPTRPGTPNAGARRIGCGVGLWCRIARHKRGPSPSVAQGRIADILAGFRRLDAAHCGQR